jgi:hypothetical protein
MRRARRMRERPVNCILAQALGLRISFPRTLEPSHGKVEAIG